MEMRRCRGTRDLLPADMVKFRNIERIFSSCCSQWGYEEVRTPLIEYLHLFTSAGTLTPDMLNRVYSFLDWDGWSGERVVLRPEGTIPVARLYVDNLQQGTLSRFFYVENTFTFDETGEKSREKWQCGAEMAGASRPEADTELILLAMDTLCRLGLDKVQLRLSHAGIIRGLFQNSGFSNGEQIDMLDKVLGGDNSKLIEMIANTPQLREFLGGLLNNKGQSVDFLKNVRSCASEFCPHIIPGLDNFIAITGLLTEAGCDYEIDLTSAQGFEYYTGVIFQIYAHGKKIGGGGRYDALIPLVGGGDVPASGFALYLDEIMKIMPFESRGEITPRKILLKNQFCTPGDYGYAMMVSNMLRQNGYLVEFDLGCQTQADYRWKLTVLKKQKNYSFQLLDCVTQQETILVGLPIVMQTLENA